MPLDSHLAPSVDIRGTVFYSPGKSNRVGHDRFLRHRAQAAGSVSIVERPLRMLSGHWLIFACPKS
jgi:hypothetical protein